MRVIVSEIPDPKASRLRRGKGSVSVDAPPHGWLVLLKDAPPVRHDRIEARGARNHCPRDPADAGRDGV